MITCVSEPAGSPERIGISAVAWSIYDFGYSLFAYVMFARYLSDWLITDLGHPDWVYTSGQLTAAIALLVLMPISGVVADVFGQHRPLLALYTIIAAACGGIVGVIDPDLGALGVLPLLAFGTVSAAATGLAFAQFDPMLAAVAPRRHWNVMSGAAVAAGYLGIVTWLLVLGDRIVGEGDKQQAFLPAALILFVLALPVLLLAREPRRTRTETPRTPRAIAATTNQRMRHVLARLRERPDIQRLLTGRFLYADAVGTVNVFAVVYMSRLGGFSEADKDHVTLLVVACAGVGAIAAGWLARRIGPRLTLLRIMPAFSIGLIAVALFGERWTVWLLAPVLGIALGTVYTVDRVFMLALTPPELRGELFGIFNLIGRVAQALGPFVLWGGVILVLHDATGWLDALDASRVSMTLIGIAAMVGIFIIRPLDDHHSEDAGEPGASFASPSDPELVAAEANPA
jgi:UMF1 family MFS transporter